MPPAGAPTSLPHFPLLLTLAAFLWLSDSSASVAPSARLPPTQAATTSSSSCDSSSSSCHAASSWSSLQAPPAPINNLYK